MSSSTKIHILNAITALQTAMKAHQQHSKAMDNLYNQDMTAIIQAWQDQCLSEEAEMKSLKASIKAMGSCLREVDMEKENSKMKIAQLEHLHEQNIQALTKELDRQKHANKQLQKENAKLRHVIKCVCPYQLMEYVDRDFEEHETPKEDTMSNSTDSTDHYISASLSTSPLHSASLPSMEAQDGEDDEGIQHIKETHPIEENIQDTQGVEDLQPDGMKDVQLKELVDVQETIEGQKMEKVLDMENHYSTQDEAEIEDENTQVIRELVMQWSEVVRMLTIRGIQEVQQVQVAPVVQAIQDIPEIQHIQEIPDQVVPVIQGMQEPTQETHEIQRLPEYIGGFSGESDLNRLMQTDNYPPRSPVTKSLSKAKLAFKGLMQKVIGKSRKR